MESYLSATWTQENEWLLEYESVQMLSLVGMVRCPTLAARSVIESGRPERQGSAKNMISTWMGSSAATNRLSSSVLSATFGAFHVAAC